jgi:aspartate aminotransferase
MMLSDRINNITEPQTIGMARKARELKEKGINVISLSLGEPDFTTPELIKQAAKKAIDDNFSYYTPVSGYAELRKAIAQKIKRDNDLDFTAEQIVVSTGAKQALANVIFCIINPGDEVIIPAPYWVTYLEQVKLAGGIPVILPSTTESDFKVTGKQLQQAITPKTKAILFSSPCNPSGSVYDKEELRSLSEAVLPHKNIYVISDEIYEHIRYAGKHESIAQFPEIKDRTIVVNGASKAFAMTGWRLGYIAAHKDIALACDKLQGQLTSGTCSIAQKALQAAVEMDVSLLQPMQNEFKKRRDLAYSLLKEIPGIKTTLPAGAFYFFPDVSAYFGKEGIRNSADLCTYLLEKAEVALVPGDAFGNDNHLRISYAASEATIKTAIQNIQSALMQLK